MSERITAGFRDFLGQGKGRKLDIAYLAPVREDEWTDYNSPISDYEQYFTRVLNGGSIVEHVDKYQNPVVIDVMSPTGTLFDLFSKFPYKDKSGIAVSLEDIRSDAEKERDAQLGIVQVTGDITLPCTWKKIDEQLDGRKADLIMERSLGGIYNLPKDAGTYIILLQRAWNLLAEKGVMLLQTPIKRELIEVGLSVNRWVELLREYKIDARFDDLNTIFLRRSSTSPVHLPFSERVFSVDTLEDLPAVESSKKGVISRLKKRR